MEHHTVPLLLVSRLVEVVARWHISAADVLSETGLTASALEDPLGRFPVAKMCALLVRARLLTGEPGLGYYDGLQSRASGYGTLGLAVQSASSVRQVLEIAEKFAPLFSTALSLKVQHEGDFTTLQLEENVDLGAARDIVVISMMLGLERVYNSLTGRQVDPSIELAIAKPAYQSRFTHLVPNWRFGRPANRILLDAASLDSPIVTADPGALRVARKLCEDALGAIALDTGFVGTVRRLLAADANGFRTVDEVASRMQFSERTLKRRLASHGISFSDLAEDARREKAIALLRSRRIAIPDVAVRLGYSTASAFIRAFQRWTGVTPAAYRRAR
jgi:AraC-like DNA-binding protein